MNSNTNSQSLFWSRRTFVACLGVAALFAVATDASAAPLTDAELAAFGAGPVKHVAGSPMNARIPQNATSPGFRLTLTRSQGGSIQVKTVGEVYVPPFSFTALERREGIWTEVSKQYAGGFVTLNRTDLMVFNGTSVGIRGISVPGANSVDVAMTFNTASDPKSVLITVTHQQPDWGTFNPQKVERPWAQRYEAKPLGGAFVYTVRPDGDRA